MADEFDVARWLFGSSREETHTNDSTMTVSYGTAMSDSDGGRVYVSVSDDATTTVIGSNGVSEQVIVGDTSVEMPTNLLPRWRSAQWMNLIGALMHPPLYN